MPPFRISALAAALALEPEPVAPATRLRGWATAEGARALEAAYAAYFSPAVVDRGIVSVVPDADAYRVTWRLQKVIDMAGGLDGSLTIEPLVYRLTPGPGGAWKLEGDHLPRVVFNVPTDKGRASGAMDFNGFEAEGLYDPAQTEFLHSTVGIRFAEGRVRDPGPGSAQRFQDRRGRDHHRDPGENFHRRRGGGCRGRPGVQGHEGIDFRRRPLAAAIPSK